MMTLIAYFNYRWHTKALIRNLGACDYECFAHWHLDAILKNIVESGCASSVPGLAADYF